MFTGIIEELGEVKRLSRCNNVILLEIEANKIFRDIMVGHSVSVNGVCLTLIKKDTGSLGFEVMPQTLRLSNLGSLKVRDKVNLEPALKLGDRLSGHFVYGHIDCVGVICKKAHYQTNVCVTISVPIGFMKYVLPKGSIAVDGISLTVAEKMSNAFNVYLIPHTLKNTTLGFKEPSDKVNIEFDILAKKNCLRQTTF